MTILSHAGTRNHEHRRLIRCRFHAPRDAWGQLALLLADGRRLAGVEVARAFPISAPGEFVCIYDAEGHEVLCIEDPSTLPPAVLETLEEELARHEFVPVVLRIDEVSADHDPAQWRVVTDRGPTTFLIEDADNDVRRLGPELASCWSTRTASAT